MKNTSKFLLLIILMSLFSTLCAVDVRTMTFAPLHNIILPKVDKTVLPNGITLYLCEDHTLPVINMRGIVRTGDVFDPVDKIGLASMTGSLIESGGVGKYSAKEFDQLLDENGIRFSSFIGSRSGSFGMSFLPEDTQLSLSILKAALITPRFEEERLQILKQEMNSDISRRNDQMDDITFREFPKLVYGSNSPYARTYEYRTIANCTRDDIIKFHKQFYQPQNISLSVIGDFDTNTITKTITDLFADWQKGNDPIPQLPKVEITYAKSINLVKRPEANQSWILMGHMAEITKKSPDYYPMIMMNNILGGAFNSRIFQKLRTQMGLSYAPAGFYDIAYDYPGLLYLMSQTKSEKTMAAIRALQEVVSDMQKVRVTDQELMLAKDNFLNTFVFNFDSNREVVGRMMEYDYYGYPMDFLQTMEAGIKKVTKEDVDRVSKQYLHPNNLIALVVGNDAAFEEPLSSLGPVNIVDIKIPPLKADSVIVSAKDISAGKDLFGKVLKNIGDISKIRNIQSTGKVQQATPMGDMDIDVVVTIQIPDKIKQSMKTPYGDMDMIVSGNTGIMKSPMGNRPLPDDAVKQLIGTSPESFFSIALDKNKLQISLGANQQIDGITYLTLQFKNDDIQFQWLIDSKTNLPAYVISTETGENGPETVRTHLIENKVVDGVLFTFKKETTDKDNKVVSKSEMTEIKTNINIPEDFFSVN